VGDGQTTLCRRFLNDTLPTPIMDEECLADGVENLQIEWGIDSNQDGSLDYYTSSPSSTELDSVLTARIHVLVRAAIAGNTATGFTSVSLGNDGKSYSMGDYVSANDAGFVGNGYVRRLFSTTVQLKNYGN
jgi:hypothetical protein